MSRSVPGGPLIEMDRPRIRYQESEGVYPVREDTLLLLRSLMDHMEVDGTGHYLDMGCGTGLCSVAAAAAGWDVCSADRNPRALALTRSNLIFNGSSSHLLLTDLFSGIPLGHHGHYDLITFNPPYLPTDMDPPGPMDRIGLFGGPSGSELAVDFVRSGRPYLAPNGTMIVILPQKGIDMLEGAVVDVGMDLDVLGSDDGSEEGLKVFSAHPSKTC
jgi:methylase of polypeptide subunit release factors